MPRYQYPTIIEDPTIDDCIKSMRVRDYLQLAGITTASWASGIYIGRPIRYVMAGIMASSGFTFASIIVLQNARARLMGIAENEREVKLYGKSE